MISQFNWINFIEGLNRPHQQTSQYHDGKVNSNKFKTRIILKKIIVIAGRCCENDTRAYLSRKNAFISNLIYFFNIYFVGRINSDFF